MPAEDQGYLFRANIMPDTASLERTTTVSDHAVKTLKENAAISSVFQLDGYSLIDGQNQDQCGSTVYRIEIPMRNGKAKIPGPSRLWKTFAEILPASKRVSSFL